MTGLEFFNQLFKVIGKYRIEVGVLQFIPFFWAFHKYVSPGSFIAMCFSVLFLIAMIVTKPLTKISNQGLWEETKAVCKRFWFPIALLVFDAVMLVAYFVRAYWYTGDEGPIVFAVAKILLVIAAIQPVFLICRWIFQFAQQIADANPRKKKPKKAKWTVNMFTEFMGIVTGTLIFPTFVCAFVFPILKISEVWFWLSGSAFAISFAVWALTPRIARIISSFKGLVNNEDEFTAQ